MNHDQLRADAYESNIDPKAPGAGVPDDQRTSSKPLRHTTGRERAFRDRGVATSSDAWKAHVRREAD